MRNQFLKIEKTVVESLLFAEYCVKFIDVVETSIEVAATLKDLLHSS
jgi:hypothetical protein